MIVIEVLGEFVVLEDFKMCVVNEKCGDDYGMNLSRLWVLVKWIKIDQLFVWELWVIGEILVWLLVLLICVLWEFVVDEFDVMF